MAKRKEYYIQTGYIGNAVLWWGVNGCGYTTDIRKAGRYSWEEVKAIIKRPQDKAWECDHVYNNLAARKEIIDGQYLDPKFCRRGRRK